MNPAPANHDANSIAAVDHASLENLQGRVLTVAGAVDSAALGQTLMHEHLFTDLRRPVHARRPDEDLPEAFKPLTLANLSRTRNGGSNSDNDVIDDLDVVSGEANAFAAVDGGTIVDVTGPHLGRAPEKLLQLSRRTGLHVVMGAGYYTPTFHPVDMDDRTVAGIAGEIVRDIVAGVAGTGIRAGIIGEIGAESSPLTGNEWKSVRASAQASRVTGAPLTFHHGGQGEEKLRVIDVCQEEGVAPENIVLGHAAGLALDKGLAERVLARGVFIEFDFLAAPGSPWGHLILMGDHTIAAGLAALIDRGHTDQILLGHDVCQKIQLKKYGGKGYDYISRHFLPVLRRLGVGDEAIHAIMVDNPARALAFDAPRPLVSIHP